MARNALIDTVIVLGIAILGVLGYKLSPQFRQNADVTLPAMTCNPAISTCTAQFPDGGKVGFLIEPGPIRPLQPLNLSVVLNGIKADGVEVDFEGSTMKMGYNRPALVGAGDHFTGQTILPVCIGGAMEWVATLRITTGNQRIAVPFHFMVAAR
jgi:hypothetical protein